MPSAGGIEGGHAHQPVDAHLALEEAKGGFALHHDDSGFDAGLVALQIVHRGGLEAVALAPAVVHTEQHHGPVLGLGAARARMEG